MEDFGVHTINCNGGHYCYIIWAALLLPDQSTANLCFKCLYTLVLSPATPHAALWVRIWHGTFFYEKISRNTTRKMTSKNAVSFGVQFCSFIFSFHSVICSTNLLSRHYIKVDRHDPSYRRVGECNKNVFMHLETQILVVLENNFF